MIVKTLPDLLESGKPINRPNLYETYLANELRRQVVSKRRQLLLPREMRFRLLEEVAIDVYLGASLEITFSLAVDRVAATACVPQGEREAYARDFLTCSFLVREKDAYRFSHKSLMEYLVAKAMAREISTTTASALSKKTLEPGVTHFLLEIGVDPKPLWSWVHSTKEALVSDFTTLLGGNAATLLAKSNPQAFIGADMSGVQLQGVDFGKADLRQTRFRQGSLKHVVLSESKFSDGTFAGASVGAVRVMIENVGMGWARPIPGYTNYSIEILSNVRLPCGLDSPC